MGVERQDRVCASRDDLTTGAFWVPAPPTQGELLAIEMKLEGMRAHEWALSALCARIRRLRARTERNGPEMPR